ncbi:MAG: hypothetical protein V3T58_06280 [Candidatus Hydrothermarchaeales archaeon]
MPGVVEALLKPDAYDVEVKGEIKLMQTHISYVFLTGDYAYKVKKPVDFGFLDFTTLDKRQFYCQEELRLNRRLCGDMYLEVVPINRYNDVIKMKGPGETVEYAVKMRQLPQEAIMSELLEKGDVTEKQIEEIARLLVDFHTRATVGGLDEDYGSVEQVRANWIQNFEQTRHLRGGVVDASAYDRLEDKVMKFIEEKEGLIEERVVAGRVRECHGDVHSGNIFIVGDEIYIFDGIEFNKAFSFTDVAAEVAFLAMDLEFYNREDLAGLFLEEYVKRSGDQGLKQLLPFYKCYRAYVRAKVTGLRLTEKNLDPVERKGIEEGARLYFELASRYAEGL